ncbi:MAG: sulfate reduction electron transfer complex DsrMKJOP subunit DsrJ [Nitrospirota bacterium]
MYDKGKVVTGIVIFVLLFAFPFWYRMGRTAPVPQPELTEKAKQAKQCVESKAYMTSFHMQLLNQWRDAVIRDGDREYVADNGKVYLASLQNTCLDCHSNKTKFCDQCHTYMGVAPYCWDCHIQPKEKK